VPDHAGNEGAGREQSFGLNIHLPLSRRQTNYGRRPEVNFVSSPAFLLRESDAIALFPGGFGTQDEAFECMTLSQTGKFGPVPLVLIDRPGGDYWQDWSAYIHKHLVQQGLISPDDPSLYTVTLGCGTEAITRFTRFITPADKLVIRLKTNLSDVDVEQLNTDFRHLGEGTN